MRLETSATFLGVVGWKLALLALVLAAAFLLWLGWRLKRLVAALRLGQRRRRGARGEAGASRLLRAAGYAVIEDQAVARGRLVVDGEPLEFDVRADALVEGPGGERLVAEVKTGQVADLTNRATRRQLLEYAHVFGVDGVLLVDMTRARVHRVEF